MSDEETALNIKLLECREALSWALDMMEMYESRLKQFGDPPHLVHSAIHEKARAKAKATLSPEDPKP